MCTQSLSCKSNLLRAADFESDNKNYVLSSTAFVHVLNYMHGNQ